MGRLGKLPAAALVLALGLGAAAHARIDRLRMKATAYSQHGRTALGTRARRGVIAADPRVLPLGTLVRIEGAGRYSGTYRVEDTGRAIKGRRIDVYIPSRQEAMLFGRKEVRVTVISEG